MTKIIDVIYSILKFVLRFCIAIIVALSCYLGLSHLLVKFCGLATMVYSWGCDVLNHNIILAKDFVSTLLDAFSGIQSAFGCTLFISLLVVTIVIWVKLHKIGRWCSKVWSCVVDRGVAMASKLRCMYVEWMKKGEYSSSFKRRLVRTLTRNELKREPMNVELLTPIDDADVSAYSKMMDAAFADNRACNIAVSGRYGAGKSSFLRTYFKGRNVLYVSLASFISQHDEGDKGGDENSDAKYVNRLEWSILQQLFYAAHRKDLPASRFKRLKSFSMGEISFVALGVIIVLVDLFAFWQPSRFFMLYELPRSVRLWVHGVAAVCGFGLIVPVVASSVYRYVVQYRPRLSLSTQALEIAPSNKGAVSAFNKVLDEIVYYFELLHFDAVIFEDIDRLKRPILFSKLREINFILNNSRQIPATNKPIRFIYAVRDDIFAGMKRVKFFDLIVPIYPVMNASMAYAMIEVGVARVLGLEHLDRDWQSFLRCFAPFISDRRFWNNIQNEFMLCHQAASEHMDRKKLLAMVVFKNYFPTEFDLAHARNGILRKIFSHETQFVSNLEAKHESAKKLSEEKLVKLSQERYLTIRDLQHHYLATGVLPQIPEGAITVSVGNASYSVAELGSDAAMDAIMGKSFEVHYNPSNRYYGTQSSIVNWLSVENSVEGDFNYKERLELIQQKNDGEARKLRETIAAEDNCIQKIKATPFRTLISRELVTIEAFRSFVHENIKDKEQGDRIVDVDFYNDSISILYKFIEAGLIDEQYEDYLTIITPGESSMSERDHQFVQKVLLGEAVPIDDLVCPDAVIEQLDEGVFSERKIFNVSLAVALIRGCRNFQSDKRLKNKYHFFCSQIAAKLKSGGLSFMAQVFESLKTRDDRDDFARQFLSVGKDMIGQIARTSNSVQGRLPALAYFVGMRLRKDPSCKFSNDVCEALREECAWGDFVSRIDVDEKMFELFMITNNLQITCGGISSIKDVALRNMIIDKGWYTPSIKNIKEVVELRTGQVLEKVEGFLGLLTDIRDGVLKHKVYADIETFILNQYQEIYKEREAREPRKIVEDILCMPDVSIRAKVVFVKRQSGLALGASSLVEKDVADAALDRKGVEHSWDAVLALVSVLGANGKVCNMVKDTIQLLKAPSFEAIDSKSQLSIDALVESPSLDNVLAERIVMQFVKKYGYKYWGAAISSARTIMLCQERAIAIDAVTYERLRSAGNGAHLSLIAKNLRWFLNNFKDSWLDERDALEMLDAKIPGWTTEWAVIALRKAISLISTSNILKRRLGNMISHKDFELRSHFSQAMKNVLVNYMPDATCRAYVLLSDKNRTADQVRDFLIRMPEYKNRKEQQNTFTFNVSIRIAEELRVYLQERGFKSELSSAKRMPEISVTL